MITKNGDIPESLGKLMEEIANKSVLCRISPLAHETRIA